MSKMWRVGSALEGCATPFTKLLTNQRGSFSSRGEEGVREGRKSGVQLELRSFGFHDGKKMHSCTRAYPASCARVSVGRRYTQMMWAKREHHLWRAAWWCPRRWQDPQKCENTKNLIANRRGSRFYMVSS